MSVLKYKIDQIVTRGFEIKNTDQLDKLHFSLSFRFKINAEEKVVCCISHYEYAIGDYIVMQLDLECYFQIDRRYFISLLKDDVLTIKTDILQYLATIAVGTARGEIHARCAIEGSPLQNIVLPPVDLTQIITTPAEFTI